MKSKKIDDDISGTTLVEEFSKLSHRILLCAARGVLRDDFMREVADILMDFSMCDAIEIRIREGTHHYIGIASRRPESSFYYDVNHVQDKPGDTSVPFTHGDDGLHMIARDILENHFKTPSPFFTDSGSFIHGNTQETVTYSVLGDDGTVNRELFIDGKYPSLVLVLFKTAGEGDGFLVLKSIERNFFTKQVVEFYEGIGRTLGDAFSSRGVTVALRERVKELTCLYGIAQIFAEPDRALEEIFQQITELLPPGWLHPEIASGRIVIDDRTYVTPGFKPGVHVQTADVVLNGKKRGSIEVHYGEKKPELDEGAFLKEERSLINAIAREIALNLERKQVEEEKNILQDQLRHADRLATIGQLAAGVAHELNEPLGNILGFAQLAMKEDLHRQTLTDLEKIVNASLYAREVIKKLMIFARELPQKKIRINLNRVINEGLYFFEARCSKEGIKLIRELEQELPDVTADPAQLMQVLINLVVNAIQAMPEGGTLTVRTDSNNDTVILTVEDTGTGMSNDIVQQIFVPFFTTKDIDQGTGLGLAVVHGIVAAHRGSIRVTSEQDKGSRFEISLPVYT